MKVFFQFVGSLFLFVNQVIQSMREEGLSYRTFIDQLFQVGVKTIPLACIAGAFVGAILALQIDSQIKDFGAQVFLGGMSTSTTLRNLGPVLIGFLLAARVGAYTTAEVGTMAITDQINAIACLGLNPLSVVLAPRMVALIIASFLLLILGLVMTFVGGMMTAHWILGINPSQFVAHIPKFISTHSLLLSGMKSLVFGFLIGVLSCFFGYQTRGGSEAVGKSVQKASVFIFLSIILFDFCVSLVFWRES